MDILGKASNTLPMYAEMKLDRSFEELAKQYVFEPNGMQDVSLSVRKANHSRIAKPMDENKKSHGFYCKPEGWCAPEAYYSADDDLVISVPDYAKFMVSSMKGEGLNATLKNQRDTIHTIQTETSRIDCTTSPLAVCPIAQGYGLGWNITQLDDDKLIGHGGSDWSEMPLAYYYANSGDGLIIFINAPSKLATTRIIEALELIDPDSPKLHEYKLRQY